MSVKIPSDFVSTFSERFAAADLGGLLALYADDIVAVPSPARACPAKSNSAPASRPSSAWPRSR